MIQYIEDVGEIRDTTAVHYTDGNCREEVTTLLAHSVGKCVRATISGAYSSNPSARVVETKPPTIITGDRCTSLDMPELSFPTPKQTLPKG